MGEEKQGESEEKGGGSVGIWGRSDEKINKNVEIKER